MFTLDEFLLYGVTALILGLPVFICTHQTLRFKTLRGFLLGLASLPIILIIGTVLLYILANYECKGDDMCEWAPLSLIVFLGVSVMSIGSLLVTTPIIKVSFSKLSRHRSIPAGWLSLIVSFAPRQSPFLSLIF